MSLPRLMALCLTTAGAVAAAARSPSAAQSRIAADAAAGRPLVVHAVVALCDNKHQGIVPVPKAIGNGQDAATNLYWGARYGLRTYLTRDAGWRPVPCDSRVPDGVVARLVVERDVARGAGASAAAYLVAEAWDGRRIRDAIGRFLHLAAGHGIETWRVRSRGRAVTFRAGGASHVVAYVGHNGLMDFTLPEPPAPARGAAPRSAIVLACKSRGYFERPLERVGAHGLLLTTGFMAPEAYTLDAALRAWLAGGTPAQCHEAAAQAYHRYQKCGLRGARRLFWTEP